MKRFIGFVGIVATMCVWAYMGFTWRGPKPAAVFYVYVPAVLCFVVGTALWELWRKK
ncbi:hypothetical protein [Mesorhizobium sp. M7A.F.Ca.US.008.03.1.1]|uniref:hypothetical protein n=1 Tax=Mesorhizobium sp. M7A.F.Ca.US.008.03.1.1 TaxID=2496742 RepID=UPI0019CF8D4C|nr:hypothetical protein [Mesorhizobium sp. M7A.F.Ca.US.008.03.1.1]